MIARFAIRHPVTVAMLFLGSLLLGLLALASLPVDLLPELQAPRIAVLLRSGDRPPEELEDAYGRPMESVLATLANVTSVRTISSTGRVLAILDFDWDADMDFALLDVQSQVAGFATDRDVDSLVVKRFDPSQEPIIVVGLRAASGSNGGLDLDGLRRLAEDRMARALERVEGVALVQVAGGRKREIAVEIEQHRLGAIGLTTDRIVSLLQQANAEAAGGTIEDQGLVHVIKGLGSFESLEDVASVPVPARPAGVQASATVAPLRLDAIASVSWVDAPVRGLVTIQGTEGVSLSIYKEAGENTVAVALRVREALDGLRSDLESLEVVVVRDQSAFISGAMDEVKTAAILGGIISIVVLMFFLRSFRALVLIALAIPISVVTTFALMSLFGLSLNVMTLGGLALGTGIVIDNAIVVLEATFRRLEEGETPFDAAEHAAGEVSAAITASTLTHCVVFLPVVFLHGVASELFGDLAFTVVASLAASLAVAVLLIPAAAARLFVAGSLGRGSTLLLQPHARVVAQALRRPGLVLSVAASVVAISLLLLPRIGIDFLPRSDSGEITARLLMPEGTRVTITQQAAARLEEAVRQAYPDALESSHAELGEAVQEDLVLSEEVPTENRGILRLRLREGMTVTSGQVSRVVESASAAIEGLSLRFESSDAVLGRLVQSGPPVRVDVRGQDLAQIEQATNAVRDLLAREPSLVDVHSSFEDRRAEVRLELDRAIVAGLGLSPDAIGRQLRQRLGAEAATTFRQGDEERDVVVRGPAHSMMTLPDLLIETQSGGPMRLGDLARVREVKSPTRIERSVGARVGTVTAQLASDSTLGIASRRVEAAIESIVLPHGVRASIGGAELARRASFRELLLATALAVALVYMVLASLFESVVHPFTILVTLPTAAVGVILAFVMTGTSASVPAFLGVVMLAGIAVNNGILLVDVANRRRQAGDSAHDAIVHAGRVRLRPILMTSLTTCLGMVPMALGGEGSELRSPLAIAVIGGLVASTLLTLVLIPVVYELLERLRPRRHEGVQAGAP